MMDGITYPNHGHTHCVPTMWGGVTLTRIMPLNLQVVLMNK
jgi:hypothetical protein